MTDHSVLIAGAGATGLMLAGELALAGIDVAIVERRADQELVGTRARGIQARTIEVFDQRRIADRFLAVGQTAQVAGFAGVRLDIGDLPTRHPYGLGIGQQQIERILAEWVAELGVPILRSTEMTDLTQDEAGVDVDLAGGRTLRADFLVGCDGGRSVVRKAAGIEFVGTDASVSCLIAEAEVEVEPEWGIHRDELGTHAFSKLETGPAIGILVTEPEVRSDGEPTPQDLRAALIRVFGTDYGVHDPAWLSRFTDVARQAATYRAGRVLVAGDAAHVHAPDGGQGLSLGVQDAVNLGWKLARVVKGEAPEGLLDTYHAERHPVGALVLRNSRAAIPFRRRDPRIAALSEVMAELFSMDQPRQRFGAMLSGLDIHYDLGPGHPLLGRRMPDLDLLTAAGPGRVFGLLHGGEAVLLDLGLPSGIDAAAWAGRVRLVEGTIGGPWELPVVGAVAAPSAVLVRPDGYVGWVGEGTSAGLEAALVRWFGPVRGTQAAGQDTFWEPTPPRVD
jgi:2-polyprenyl-6-methoxyphenol hydroxylase-like FAD-dependent oxidoreductase